MLTAASIFVGTPAEYVEFQLHVKGFRYIQKIQEAYME